jgi:hypothetical protein
MGTVEDFLTFRKLITTPFITIIYLLGAIFITLLALSTIGEGYRAPSYFGIDIGRIYVYSGFFMLIVGNLLWRVFCELIIVQFRIHDELVSINNKIASTGGEILKPPYMERASGGKPPSGVIKCPYCGSEIPSVSRRCPICGLEIPPPP